MGVMRKQSQLFQLNQKPVNFKQSQITAKSRFRNKSAF